MAKNKKPEKDFNDLFEKISSQLERVIICLEKRLSGQVFPDFNSKKELENKED